MRRYFLFFKLIDTLISDLIIITHLDIFRYYLGQDISTHHGVGFDVDIGLKILTTNSHLNCKLIHIDNILQTKLGSFFWALINDENFEVSLVQKFKDIS